ncbi:MAG: hypothetical protein Q9196_007273, partial [Gyalolechia fulgens]
MAPKQRGDRYTRPSSIPNLGISIAPVTGHSSPTHIPAYGSARSFFPNDRHIGASTRYSNKAISATRDREWQSQNIRKPDLPGGRLTTQHNRISDPSRIESNHPKVSNIPQRKTSQQTARSASSLPPPDSDIPECKESLSDDARHIQRKLLQLHVLHSASADVHLQWRESAKVHFQQQFEDLRERHVEIADIAHQTRELKNRSALVEWCRNVQPSEVERRVLTLSRCIEEIYGNLDKGGKYHHVISDFEAWFTQVRMTQESRQSDAQDHAANEGYVEEIGA